MSETEENAAIGRAHRRLKEIEEEIKGFQIEAKRIGKVFSELGEALQNSPSGIVFEGESFDGKFSVYYTLNKIDQKDLNLEAVQLLVRDYRELLVEKGELERLL